MSFNAQSTMKKILFVFAFAVGATAQGTYTDFYSQSWIGCGAPSVVANNGGLIPVVPSDAPVDPGMGTAQHFNGIVYDGQYFANKRSATAYSTSDCLVFDWNYAGGWIAGIIAHDTHYWDFFSNNDATWSNPNLKLVMWAKGKAGGEEKKFCLNMQEWPVTSPTVNTGNTPASAIPAITTSWKKIVIPISAFLGGKPIHATGYHTLCLAPTGTGSMVLYLDHIYFTTSIVSEVNEPLVIHRADLDRGHGSAVTFVNQGMRLPGTGNTSALDLRGRLLDRSADGWIGALGENVLILRTQPAGR
jgi:hypothetical protein